MRLPLQQLQVATRVTRFLDFVRLMAYFLTVSAPVTSGNRTATF